MKGVYLLLILLIITGCLDFENFYEEASAEDQEAYRNAKTSEDPNKCKEITSKNLKYDCYVEIAKKTKNAETCELISKSETRDSCLATF